MDGAGHLRIIRNVMVPLSWPAITAVTIITGQYIWNDFFWPNLFISDPNRIDRTPGPVLPGVGHGGR